MSDLMQLGQTVLGRQPFSRYLGTELLEFEPGRAVMALPVRGDMLQHHGFVHGGVISYLVDSAITFAGGSVLGENVVTAEYKVNYLKPARGQRLVATAAVESSGSRIAVCRCEVVSIEDDRGIRCALGQGTIARLG